MKVTKLFADASSILAASTIFISSAFADDCMFISIKYTGEDNFILTKGNCTELYEMCGKDFCRVTKGGELDSTGTARKLDNTSDNVIIKQN